MSVPNYTFSWPETSAQLTPVAPLGITSFKIVSTSFPSQPLITWQAFFRPSFSDVFLAPGLEGLTGLTLLLLPLLFFSLSSAALLILGILVGELTGLAVFLLALLAGLGRLVVLSFKEGAVLTLLAVCFLSSFVNVLLLLRPGLGS